MKRLTLLTLVFSVLLFQAFSQMPVWSDAQSSSYLSPSYYPQMKADHFGNLIVVSGHGASTDSTDIQILKYSPGGTLLWSYVFDGDSNLADQATSFTIDENNDIYVVGSTGVSIENDGLNDYVNTAILTFKVSSEGALVWKDQLGGYGRFPSRGDEIVSYAGSTYVLAAQSQTAIGNDAMFIMKFNNDGQVTHTHIIALAEAANYIGRSLRLIDGRIHALATYVTESSEQGYIHHTNDTSMGTSSSQWIYKPLNRPPMSVASDDVGNVYLGFGADQRYKLIKIDSNGTKVWRDSVPSNLPANVGADRVGAIAIDAEMNVYVTGLHHGEDYGQSSSSLANVLTRKYAPNGTLLWSRTFMLQDSMSHEHGVDVKVEGDEVWIGGRLLENGGNTDYLVLKYNEEGDLIGTIRYSGPAGGDEDLSSIVATDDGVYVTGFTDEIDGYAITTQYYTQVTPASINEQGESRLEVNVFPNPFQDVLFIEVEHSIQPSAKIELFDLSGRKVLEERVFTFHAAQVSTSGLDAGTYLFKVSSGAYQACGRLVHVR